VLKSKWCRGVGTKFKGRSSHSEWVPYFLFSIEGKTPKKKSMKKIMYNLVQKLFTKTQQTKAPPCNMGGGGGGVGGGGDTGELSKFRTKGGGKGGKREVAVSVNPSLTG